MKIPWSDRKKALIVVDVQPGFMNARDSGNILVVGFARPDEEIPKRFEEEKARILQRVGDRKITVILASTNNLIDQAKQAHAIDIIGGETEKLMETLKRFPDFTEAIKGKTVGGSSAGAYILSRYYHSASSDTVYEGFGLVPVRVICHYGSDKFETRGNPMEQMKKYPENLELVTLRDCEWRVFNI